MATGAVPPQMLIQGCADSDIKLVLVEAELYVVLLNLSEIVPVWVPSRCAGNHQLHGPLCSAGAARAGVGLLRGQDWATLAAAAQAVLCLVLPFAYRHKSIFSTVFLSQWW